MDYFGVKLFIALGFFTTLIAAAYWAGAKLADLKKYWEDEDGR